MTDHEEHYGIFKGPSLLGMVLSLLAEEDEYGHRPTVTFSLDKGTRTDLEVRAVVDGLERVSGNGTAFNVVGTVIRGLGLGGRTFRGSMSTHDRTGDIYFAANR